MAVKHTKKGFSKKKEIVVYQRRRTFPLRNPIEYTLFTLLVALIAALVTFFYVTNTYQSATVIKTLSQLHPTPSANTQEKISDENLEKEESLQEKNRGQENSAIILHGPRDKKQVALTFDAEMTNGMKNNLLLGRVKNSYDKRIINTLIQTNTKATLFLTGMWIELYSKESKEFVTNPLFELGSHSYADTSFEGYCFGLKKISDIEDIEQIGVTQKLLSELTGKVNKLFRFPGGCYSQKDIDIIHTAGMNIVHWDAAGGDGFNNNVQSIEKSILASVQNGSIILLHMNGAPTAPKTAEALPHIITTLKQKGYTFVKISELLNY